MFVVVSDPVMFPNEIVVVNVTTRRELSVADNSCVFTRGDHPFLTEMTSYVIYRAAGITKDAVIRRRITSRDWRKGPIPFSSGLLRRVITGFRESPFAPVDALLALKRQGLIHDPILRAEGHRVICQYRRRRPLGRPFCTSPRVLESHDTARLALRARLVEQRGRGLDQHTRISRPRGHEEKLSRKALEVRARLCPKLCPPTPVLDGLIRAYVGTVPLSRT